MWAIVPIKPLSLAKQRLSTVLSASERQALMQAMCEDVVRLLVSTESVTGVTLLSDDLFAKSLAARYALEWVSEESLGAKGLNPALQALAEKLHAQGKEQLMVIHGDLPLLKRVELDAIFSIHDAYPRNHVTLVADKTGQGTNCLLLNSVSGFTFNFGLRSRSHHLDQAAKQGCTSNVVLLDGSGLDIDTQADLHKLINHSGLDQNSKTCRVLKGLNLFSSSDFLREQTGL